jgi:hypothetical protein
MHLSGAVLPPLEMEDEAGAQRHAASLSEIARR